MTPNATHSQRVLQQAQPPPDSPQNTTFDNSSIELGDFVWARCEFTGDEGFKPVVRLFRNTADTLVHLSYRRDPGSARRGAAGLKGGDAEDGDDLSATITGTDEHPFWSLTRGGWIAMGELKPGERLLLAGGQAATATAVRIERLAKPVTVYNFEVADWHTYHVGSQEAGWVFVHNQCAINPLREVHRNADMAVRAANRAAASVPVRKLESLWLVSADSDGNTCSLAKGRLCKRFATRPI